MDENVGPAGPVTGDYEISPFNRLANCAMPCTVPVRSEVLR